MKDESEKLKARREGEKREGSACRLMIVAASELRRMARRRTCDPQSPLLHHPTETPGFLHISSVAILTFVRMFECS